MRVVLDTNIFISAILFGGNCEEVLRLASLGAFEIIISESIMKEIQSVLKNKFKWTKYQYSETISYLKSVTTEIKPEVSQSVINNDPTDNKIIECAVSVGAKYIVTGDRNHLLPLKKYSRIKIITASDFLKL